MKLITRRVLFGFCIILFMIAAPIAVLYTFGFRFDVSQKKILQTGIIYITPTPQNDIKILVDGKEEPGKLNIKGILKKDYVLYNLLPKTYNIKVAKEGYHRWEKNLVVLPGIITYVQPLLLPSNPPNDLIFSDFDIVSWSISDEFKKIFYLKNDARKISANIYDFYKKSLSASFAISGGPTTAGKTGNPNTVSSDLKIFIAPNGQKFGLILPEKNTRIVLLNSTEKNISVLADMTLNDKIIASYWDNFSRYFFYLTSKGELYSFDTILNKSKRELGDILGFSLKNNDIYYLDKNNLLIYKSPIGGLSEKKQLSYAPLNLFEENQNYKIKEKNTEKSAEMIVSGKNDLAIIAPDKNLFAIGANGIPRNLGNNIESAKFSKSGESLIYNSQYEIFTYKIDNDQENLVTRLSQKISSVNWHNGYEHVWFVAGNVLKNIELDSRPVPNIVDFIAIPENSTGIFYSDSGAIYYDRKESGSLKIFRAETNEKNVSYGYFGK